MLLTPYWLLLFPFTTPPWIFAALTALIFLAVALLARRAIWFATEANQDTALNLAAAKIDRWLMAAIIIYCLLDATLAYPALNTPLLTVPLKIAFAAITLFTLAGMVPKLLCSQHFSPAFPETSIRFLTRSARLALAFFAILLAWDALPWPILPIFFHSNFALAAFAITLYAARRTLADAAAGLALHASRKLPLGATIRSQNLEGTIEQIDLRSTTVRLSSGEAANIPNSVLAKNIIILSSIR